MRSIQAYSKPVGFTKVTLDNGTIYNQPEGVVMLANLATSKSDLEVIELCAQRAKDAGLQLGSVFVSSILQDGFYAGASLKGRIIYECNQ